MRQLIIIAIILLMNFNASAQGHAIDTSFFVIKDRIYYTDSFIYRNMTSEFCAYRIHLSDSEFIEGNLFGGDTFLIQGSNWFIRNMNEWQPFFSDYIFNSKLNSVLTQSKFILIPNDKVYFQGNTCYKYRIAYSDKITTNVFIIFEVSQGIVAIINKDVFIRTKVIPNPKFICN